MTNLRIKLMFYFPGLSESSVALTASPTPSALTAPSGNVPPGLAQNLARLSIRPQGMNLNNVNQVTNKLSISGNISPNAPYFSQSSLFKILEFRCVKHIIFIKPSSKLLFPLTFYFRKTSDVVLQSL